MSDTKNILTSKRTTTPTGEPLIKFSANASYVLERLRVETDLPYGDIASHIIEQAYNSGLIEIVYPTGANREVV